MAAVARIAIDSPLPQLDRVFEYAIPATLTHSAVPGVRVKVPLRAERRIISGWVLGVADEAEFSGKLSEIDSVVSEARVLTDELVQLARAVADRQAGTLADVLRLAIPKHSAQLEQRWLDDESGERARRLAASQTPVCGDTTESPDTGVIPNPRAEVTAAPWADAILKPEIRFALHTPVGVSGHEPRAMGALADLAATTLARGESAIVLVPDFRDVELIFAALERRVPAELLRRFDSQLKPMPRYEQFLRALEPIPQVIVGTRAAVWAPAHSLGLIAMWDDGDESYREPHAPYPHTREVALMRATMQGCAVVLAAHTPSLEARRLVASGWLTELTAPGPAQPRVIPAAATIGDDAAARAARIPEFAWQTASRALRDGPVLVQVGRAGYRPRLRCADCREIARCKSCAGELIQSSDSAPVSCRVCGAIQPDWHCGECGGNELRAGLVGHERTAEELGRAFPGVPVVVADAQQRQVTIGATPALVVATHGAEPIAEDGYRAVLLLDAEFALAREALDTVVDALRVWSNAAALSADGAIVAITGAVSPPVEALQHWQQAPIVDAELEQRRELEFPPSVRVATVRGTQREVDAALRRIRDLQLREVSILGPLPDEEDPKLHRATLRFGYRVGSAVAAAIKTELVVQATARRGVGGRGAASTLRVHFDDYEVFA
ncbi:primosomal protein N' [uncultured Gulosibacter sp.]|uniref:primosomal protein N' family DNA-binding protein n=1 Tax=uncultured Gulosibacter sp. TaxID=1339167 RepID=UPI002889B6AC|nr:primosomal protein N' [uncultured Gulosibacter sp.]